VLRFAAASTGRIIAEWPCNVHPLENVAPQNAELATRSISAELVQATIGGGHARLPSFDEARDEFTRNYLSQILQITGGNVSQAARNRTTSTSCSPGIN
jgi:two-component system, NtrC family, response regulator GlrR